MKLAYVYVAAVRQVHPPGWQQQRASLCGLRQLGIPEGQASASCFNTRRRMAFDLRLAIHCRLPCQVPVPGF